LKVSHKASDNSAAKSGRIKAGEITSAAFGKTINVKALISNTIDAKKYKPDKILGTYFDLTNK